MKDINKENLFYYIKIYKPNNLKKYKKGFNYLNIISIVLYCKIHQIFFLLTLLSKHI